MGILAGAGGISSNTTDMLIFSKAVLDPKSPIAAAVKTTLSVRVPGEAPGVEQALGWEVVHPAPGRELLLHGGQMGGYRSMLALEAAKGRAAVVLINSAAEPSATDLGLHLLLGSPVVPTPPVPPAPPPPTKHTEIPLPKGSLWG
jgi:serine-type D-Ala-D-Ala carboxypeptidase/endopeptidase